MIIKIYLSKMFNSKASLRLDMIIKLYLEKHWLKDKNEFIYIKTT